jgi:hypothetical protein
MPRRRTAARAGTLLIAPQLLSIASKRKPSRTNAAMERAAFMRSLYAALGGDSDTLAQPTVADDESDEPSEPTMRR